VRKADNLPPSCAVFTKSGSLNFLEPSGPDQACNGTALPLLPVITQSGSGSGTGSTQPREVKLRSYLNKKVAAPGSENRD